MEIDLIPADYRARLARRRLALRLGRRLAALGLAVALLWGGLHAWQARLGARLAELQAAQAEAGRQGAALAAATRRRDALRARWTAWQRLHGTVTPAATLRSLSAALGETDLWLERLAFRRDPADAARARLSLSGRAADHSVLSAVAERLRARPLVRSVTVLRTRSLRHGRERLIAFEAEVALGAAGEGGL